MIQEVHWTDGSKAIAAALTGTLTEITVPLELPWRNIYYQCAIPGATQFLARLVFFRENARVGDLVVGNPVGVVPMVTFLQTNTYIGGENVATAWDSSVNNFPLRPIKLFCRCTRIAVISELNKGGAIDVILACLSSGPPFQNG